MRLLRVAAGLLALCLLQSCGGGGGGGGGNTSRFTITLDRTSIAFETYEDTVPAAQTIIATARGDYDGTLFVGATVEGQGIDPTISILLSDTSATISVKAASGLAIGTYTGRLIFHACSDQACATHVGGTPIAVSYTVTVKRGVRLTPSVLQLPAVSGVGTSTDVSVELPVGANSYGLDVPPTQFDWLSVINQTPSSFTVVTKSMPVGNYRATITVTSALAVVHLTVLYNVSAPPGGDHGIIATPPTLTLGTTEGAQVSQTLLVTPPTWNPGLTASVASFNGAPTNWLTVVPATGGFMVTASAAALSQGSYSANIVIDTVPAHETKVVPVAFTVGAGFVKPAKTVITVDSDTTPVQLAGRVRIDIGGGPPVSWTASTTTPWLTLTRAAGQTGTDVEFAIDPTTVNGWSNFSDHAATLRIEGASPTLTPIDCDVEVQLRMAEVTGLGPYLLIEGQSSKVIVRGRGFSGLVPVLTHLRFGNATAVHSTLVDDTQLVVDVGALPLGTHEVKVINALNRTLQSRALRVMAASSYAYKAIPLSSNRVDGPLVYDAERQNAYVPQGFLLRFPVVSASTVAETITNAGGVRIGLTADGANFVTGGQTSLALLDRDTLATVPGSDFDTFGTRNPGVYGNTPVGDNGLMVSNDSRLWYTQYHWLHLETKDTGRVTLGPGIPSSVTVTPRAMSRNGARIVGIDASVNPAFDTFPLVSIDTVDSVVRHRSAAVSVNPQIMISEDGERVLAGTSSVFDGQLARVGDVVLPPSASDYEPLIGAISPDGTRVYVFTYESSDYNNPTPSHHPRVYVFDSSAAVTAPQTLPVLGYFEVDDYPGCMMTGCFSPTFAAITPDGGALLVVSNRNFLVVPTDTALTSAATAPGNQKTRSAPSLRTVPWKVTLPRH